MVSRKKSRGKERKAKKAEENKREHLRMQWQSWVCGVIGNKFISECFHGLGDLKIPGNDHPMTRFMDAFIDSAINKSIPTIVNLRDTYQTHSEVWTNNLHREHVIKMLTVIGTTFLQVDATSQFNMADYIAIAIVMLENYDATSSSSFDSVLHNRIVATKIRDLSPSHSVRRDVLKFYSKRLSCKCLMEMHSKARQTLSKVGHCFNCSEVYERKDLMVCSRCRVSQFCSRQCLVAYWPMHQSKCDNLVKFNKQKTLGV